MKFPRYSVAGLRLAASSCSLYSKNTTIFSFTPVQYEGEEESPNIIYTAEAVGQQAIPAVDYLLAEGYTKFYLIGTDYVYPQTTNIVLFEYLLSKGIPVENIGGGIRLRR